MVWVNLLFNRLGKKINYASSFLSNAASFSKGKVISSLYKKYVEFVDSHDIMT